MIRVLTAGEASGIWEARLLRGDSSHGYALELRQEDTKAITAGIF